MRALITAGGRGTRLRPLTHTSNKHLIPIANKPIIHYALEAVAAAGIRDVGIVLNPDTGEEIRQGLGDGAAWGLAITYVMQEAPLGLAHVIQAAEGFLRGEPFVFFLGDNVVVGGIRQFVERFEARGDHCHLVLARVRDPQRFGVAEVQEDRIVRVVEKPARPASRWTPRRNSPEARAIEAAQTLSAHAKYCQAVNSPSRQFVWELSTHASTS